MASHAENSSIKLGLSSIFLFRNTMQLVHEMCRCMYAKITKHSLSEAPEK